MWYLPEPRPEKATLALRALLSRGLFRKHAMATSVWVLRAGWSQLIHIDYAGGRAAIAENLLPDAAAFDPLLAFLQGERVGPPVSN